MSDEIDDISEEDFAAALGARYRRLSLLTLDLAEEAGEAAVNFSLVDRADRRSDRPGRFERRLAAMTRAVWAHRTIEQMRQRHERAGTGRRPPAAISSTATPSAGMRPASPISSSIDPFTENTLRAPRTAPGAPARPTMPPNAVAPPQSSAQNLDAEEAALQEKLKNLITGLAQDDLAREEAAGDEGVLDEAACENNGAARVVASIRAIDRSAGLHSASRPSQNPDKRVSAGPCDGDAHGAAGNAAAPDAPP